MVDMQLNLEEKEETWQASPFILPPFFLGSLVCYQASRYINAESCSLFFSLLHSSTTSKSMH